MKGVGLDMMKSISWRLAALKRETKYQLARLTRPYLVDTTFIGITGTAGKTTTKDLTCSMLSILGPCQGSPGSSNWLADIVDLILKTTRRHRFCVAEISADEPGSLDIPLKITRPRIGVVTLVQRDHVKNFRTLEAIAEEKGKLVECLPSDGIAVLNYDDPLVRKMGERARCRVVWFGTDQEATLRLISARSCWPDPLLLEVEHEGQRFEVRTRLHGTHLAVPAMAALGVAIAVGMPLEKAGAALSDIPPAEGRMQPLRMRDGVTFLRDDWKAPYWSLDAPLSFMKDANAGRKVVVMGTLSDYSLSASKLYPKVAQRVKDVSELAVFVGAHAIRALKARTGPDDHSIVAFTDVRDAAIFLRRTLRDGDLVLLKGSNRADHLFRLILDREDPVQCWRTQCGLSRFCDRCPELYRMQPASTDVIFERGGPRVANSDSVVSDGRRVIVVIGLGNPGEQFVNTPHNVGQRVVDRVAALVGATWRVEPEGWAAEFSRGEVSVKLFKPNAMMNVCGSVVRRYLDRVGCAPSDCLLIHDDMDLSLGVVRFKKAGSDAGHKGVRSLIVALENSGELPRIRLGVKNEGDSGSARDRVLEDFGSDNLRRIGEMEGAAASALFEFIDKSVEANKPLAV